MSFATDANVSGNAKSLVPADQPAPATHVHIATSRLSILLPTTYSNAGSDLPACRKETAVIKPLFTIRKPNVCNAPLPSDMYVTWVRYPRLNVKLNILENQTATRSTFPPNNYCGLPSIAPIL